MSDQDKPIEFICRVVRPWFHGSANSWIVEYNPISFKKFPTKKECSYQIIVCEGELIPGQYLYAYNVQTAGAIVGYLITEYTLVYPTPESSELELANQVRNPDIWPNQIMEAQ